MVGRPLYRHSSRAGFATPTCTLCGNLVKGTSTRTELNMTSGSSANRARRRRRCLATFTIFVTRLPRLPPGTTYLLPCGKPLRHPVTHLCCRPESNIGEHPRSPRRLRERDAMKQYQMDCGPSGLPPSLPSPPLGGWGRHRVPCS